MFEMKTVTQAIAPLMKVQENLKKVAANRRASAKERRQAAKEFTQQAEQDEQQEEQARAILANLTTLLAPTKG